MAAAVFLAALLLVNADPYRFRSLAALPLHYNLGLLLLPLGRSDEAAEEFRMAVTLDTSDTDARRDYEHASGLRK